MSRSVNAVSGVRHRVASNWKSFTRALRHLLPTSLYARNLLIIILPMILLQAVVAAVFMERHWQLVTERLSAAVTRDIAAIIEILETEPLQDDYERVIRIAREKLDLGIYIETGKELPPAMETPLFSILDRILAEQITRQINRPFWIDTFGNGSLVEIRIRLDDNRIMRIFTGRSQTYASNTHIFIVWMVSASLVLLGISILFLRGQIRPILALAKAAESFGRGQSTQGFSPRGADEVRRAGLAFILMRERIEKQIEQRTAMLNGVSHDLRTILTRFRLQLALAGDRPELAGMDQDVDDMQSMLEGYLAFARGDGMEEELQEQNLKPYMEKLQSDFAMGGGAMTFAIRGEDRVQVRPNAFRRLVDNIVSNAGRHAKNLHVEIRHPPNWLTMTFDDDGPGIPPEARDDVFKPFFRLDQARNLDASGTGLGLAIVRDIAMAHGGEVTLGESPAGGLRVTVKLPA